jgi:dephospho-CoA kinase
MAPGGTAYADIVRAFGDRILAADGAIDRKALGAHVFADAAARRRLEALVHPRIREAETRYLSAGAPDSVAVVDAALLIESGQHLRFARLVVVFCEPREQLRRLMARDGLTEADARARLDAQMPPGQKRGFGHYVVDNSRAPAETDAQVDAVIAALRSLAADHAPRPRVPVDRAVRALATGPRRGPRGLDPGRVLEAIAESGGLDMAQVAALLDPPHDGPWYLAADAASGGEVPETLALPVAVWSAGQRPGDAPFAIAAAASMARLTHRDPVAISGAVLAGLASIHFLVTGEASARPSELAEWTAAATAWSGATPPSSALATVRALAGGTEHAAIKPELRERVARVLGAGAA